MGAGRELFGRRKDGSRITVEVGLHPIRTEMGVLVLASVVDITDRHRLDEAHHRALEAGVQFDWLVGDLGTLRQRARTRSMRPFKTGSAAFSKRSTSIAAPCFSSRKPATISS
jgi:hypothetical protein